MSEAVIKVLWGGAALFGLCLGSFWNVCIYRLPREGIRPTWPIFSFCPHCFSTLRWYENLPLVSYLLQRGKCRHCYVWISPRYPFVELLGGAILFFLATQFLQPRALRWDLFLSYTLFFSAIVVASFIDLDLRIIPDEIDKPGMVIGPLLCLMFPEILPSAYWLKLPGVPWSESAHVQAFLSSVAGVVTGAGLIYAIGVVGKLLFRKEAMGFGDVKFMGMLGSFLGPVGVGVAFLVACFSGAVIGILKKLFSRDPYIPFGPFLAFGAVMALFFRPLLISLVRQYLQLLKGIV